jgi:hypothetical protein
MHAWHLCALVFVAASSVALASSGCATQVTEDDQASSGNSGGSSGTTTTSASGSGGGDLPDGGQGGAGGCSTAADCVAFGDSCSEGACINGACGKLPLNELGPCEDGFTCTQNDSCQDGVCVGGALKFCPASNSCSVGSCDVITDECVQVPGNDGAGCIDDDACTLTGICSSGVCTPGQLVDCSFLDDTCSVGVCDPQLGCVVAPLNDGASCDDALFCTVNDVCTAGACAGSPNTCAAPGDVCMIGSCDELAQTCVAVPGNNGASCDDGNLCTLNETCLAGVCGDGMPGNNGLACDDGNGCTSGTTCAGGACTNAMGEILQCINGDACCPAGCVDGTDSDCVVCYPIGYDSCPTGATEFCSPDPPDPTNAVQAKLACDTCYGFSCFLEDGDCAGLGYGPQPPGLYVCGDPYWGYTDGCSGEAGRVWSICGSFTTYGYWAP